MHYINLPLKIFLYGILSVLSINAEEAELSQFDAEKIGVEAYIYGYPLVTMDFTRRISTNVEKPFGSSAPMGQFAHMRNFPDAQFNTVTAPNVDTLYSVAWLDLANEPMVLHVPDEPNRYYLMPMLSAWTDVFVSLGTRTTGTAAGDYVITGPNWKGILGTGIKEIKSPTNMVWVLGRTYTSGTPEDYSLVHSIQNQYALVPLSSFEKVYNPPKGVVDPNIDMKTPVRMQVNNLSAEEFFNRLAMLMVDNPPASTDKEIIAKMAKIGILPGQQFDSSQNPKIALALKDVPTLGYKKIMDQHEDAGKDINGWLYSLRTGEYQGDYNQRAFITAVGLGANLPEDAIHPMTNIDSKGEALSGAYKYVIHFNKGQEPPVKGFWSLTMYNDKVFFVANPLNRYSLNSRGTFKYNPDGSLDLYIQNEPSEKDKESNWLPAPKGFFMLMLRAYWPENSILNGRWAPPAVQKVEEKKTVPLEAEPKKS
ncbi:MAG: DUF1254 domain-containing protein [Parachlamydiaceae bacterium]|nr:DUF1254 domain-containing protein [Parachlamydiaceae bacterium]